MHTWWHHSDIPDDIEIHSGQWFPDHDRWGVDHPSLVRGPDAQGWYTHIYRVQIAGCMHDVSVRYKNYQNDPTKIHVQIRYMSGWQTDASSDVICSRSLREFSVLKRDFKPKIHDMFTTTLEDMSDSLGSFLGQIAHASFDVQQKVKSQIESIYQDAHRV